jgi:hypothetical protein
MYKETKVIETKPVIVKPKAKDTPVAEMVKPGTQYLDDAKKVPINEPGFKPIEYQPISEHIPSAPVLAVAPVAPEGDSPEEADKALVATYEAAIKAYERGLAVYLAIPEPKPQVDINKFALVENRFDSATKVFHDARKNALRTKVSIAVKAAVDTKAIEDAKAMEEEPSLAEPYSTLTEVKYAPLKKVK